MNLRTLILASLALPCSHVIAAESCNSLDACFARMQSLAKSSTSGDCSLTPEEMALTDKVGELAVARAGGSPRARVLAQVRRAGDWCLLRRIHHRFA
jgi:hypothetical protein